MPQSVVLATPASASVHSGAPPAQPVCSFFGRAVFWILSSDFLNPPNCEKKVVNNAQDLDGFQPKPIQSNYNSYISKPVRMVGRMVAYAAAAVIVAPMGALWNGGKAFLALTGRATDQTLGLNQAFLTDCVVSAIVFAIFKNRHRSLSPLGQKICIAVGVMIGKAIFPLVTEGSATILLWLFEERGQGLVARDRCGIVAADGGLVNAEILEDARFEAITKLMRLIQWVQKRLPADHKIASCDPLEEASQIIATVTPFVHQSHLLRTWIARFQAQVNAVKSSDAYTTSCFTSMPEFRDGYFRCTEDVKAKFFAGITPQLQTDPASDTYQTIRRLIREQRDCIEFFGPSLEFDHYPSTAQEIEERYRDLRVRCHPDKNGGTPEATAIWNFLESCKNQAIADLDFGLSLEPSLEDSLVVHLLPGQTAAKAGVSPNDALNNYNLVKAQLLAQEEALMQWVLAQDHNLFQSIMDVDIEEMVDAQYSLEVRLIKAACKDFLSLVKRHRNSVPALEAQNQSQLDDYNRVRRIILDDAPIGNVCPNTQSLLKDYYATLKKIDPNDIKPLVDACYHEEMDQVFQLLHQRMARLRKVIPTRDPRNQSKLDSYDAIRKCLQPAEATVANILSLLMKSDNATKEQAASTLCAIASLIHPNKIKPLVAAEHHNEIDEVFEKFTQLKGQWEEENNISVFVEPLMPMEEPPSPAPRVSTHRRERPSETKQEQLDLDGLD